jgi:O-antigen/teichoic acid export membrane protein
MNVRALPRGPPSALARFAGITGLLFTGTLAASGLAFLTQIMLTRRLPVAEVGPIAALLATINFLTPMATAGVNYFLLQSYGREGAGAARWLPASARLLALATLLSGLLLAAYVFRSSSGGADPTLLYTAGLLILLGQMSVELGSSRLQLDGRYGALSAWQGMTQAGRFIVVLTMATSAASTQRILGGYAVVGALSLASGVVLLSDLRRRLGQGAQSGSNSCGIAAGAANPPLMDAARESIPFALMTMFYVFYFQGPIVTVEWILGDAAAGAYNAAFLVISAMSLIPQVIYMKFLLPKICRWAEHDRLVFGAAFHVGVPAMLACGLCLMVAIVALAPALVTTLFGQAYVAGVPALLILAVTVPVRFVQSAYSSLFIKTGEVARKVCYLGISAVVGGLSSVLLVPAFGLQGAAAATLLAEVSLLALHIRGTARFIEGIDVRDTYRPRTFRASLRHLLLEAHSEH